MISIDFFLLSLLGVSILTGLTTEAIKTICVSLNKKYCSNIIAGIVSVILSVLMGVGFLVFTGIPLDAEFSVCLFALAYMSWLCAMNGYDKVVQAIIQFKTKWKD